MKESSLCFSCTNELHTDSVTLWDGHQYCRPCVETASPRLYELAANGKAFEETLTRDEVSVALFVRSFARSYLAYLGVLLFLPLGLLTLIHQEALVGLLAAMFFFGGGGILNMTIWASVNISAVRDSLPRTISVQGGTLKVKTPLKEENFRLTTCSWYPSHGGIDDPSFYSGQRRCIAIRISAEDQISCGYTDEMRAQWSALLTLTKTSLEPLPGWWRILHAAGLGTCIGAPIGVVLGLLVTRMTGNELWPFALGGMGSIQGALAAAIYSNCTDLDPEIARGRLNPILVGVQFSLIGGGCGAIGALPGALIFGTLSSLLGLVLVWACRAKIRRERSYTASSRHDLE